MKLWTVYVPTSTDYGFEPREVEVSGEPGVGYDETGCKWFTNTHFATRDEAWASLRTHYEIGVKWAGQNVRDAKAALAEENRKAGRAAADFAKFHEAFDDAQRKERAK